MPMKYANETVIMSNQYPHKQLPVTPIMRNIMTQMKNERPI